MFRSAVYLCRNGEYFHLCKTAGFWLTQSAKSVHQGTSNCKTPSVGFWHTQSAKSVHQGTSNCGMATAVRFARALGYCMMLLPPIHDPQSPHAFCSADSDHHQVRATLGMKRCPHPATGKAKSPGRDGGGINKREKLGKHLKHNPHQLTQVL